MCMAIHAQSSNVQALDFSQTKSLMYVHEIFVNIEVTTLLIDYEDYAAVLIILCP